MECVKCECVWIGTPYEEKGVSGYEDLVSALPILWEQGDCWTCVSVWVAVVCVV